MKKIFKNPIFMFVLGLIIAGVGGVVAVNINANNVEYTSVDENWNVSSVNEAIDDLYLHTDAALKPILLWTNPNPSASFAAQTISLDLSDYKYVILTVISGTGYDYTPRASSILPVLDDYQEEMGVAAAGTRSARFVIARPMGITFSTSNASSGNNFTIPYKIYGVKGEMELDLGISE